MASRLQSALADGYKIVQTFKFTVFGASVHVYLPKEYMPKMLDKQLVLIEKDGKYALISEDE